MIGLTRGFFFIFIRIIPLAFLFRWSALKFTFSIFIDAFFFLFPFFQGSHLSRTYLYLSLLYFRPQILAFANYVNYLTFQLQNLLRMPCDNLAHLGYTSKQEMCWSWQNWVKVRTGNSFKYKLWNIKNI